MTTQFLYHAVPPHQIGTVLLRLNRLRSAALEAWARQIAKYAGRERVLDYVIPHLGVLWNDVLHLSTIHPFHLASACSSVGLWSPMWDRRWYRVPSARLAGLPGVCFASESFWVNNSPHDDHAPLAPPEAELRSFDPTEYRELTKFRGDYVPYLRSQIALGRRPLQFPKIPHALVVAELDTGPLDTVAASEAP